MGYTSSRTTTTIPTVLWINHHGALAQLVGRGKRTFAPTKPQTTCPSGQKSPRGISTAGSARHSHCRGQRFESAMLHHNLSENAYDFRHFSCSGIQKASIKIQRRSSRNVEAYLCVETRGLPALISANCRFCLQSPLQEHKNARDCSFGWHCQVDCPFDGDFDCFLGGPFSVKRRVVATDGIVLWKLLQCVFRMAYISTGTAVKLQPVRTVFSLFASVYRLAQVRRASRLPYCVPYRLS